jgi:ABC-2 type transport system ATP-binding protein
MATFTGEMQVLTIEVDEKQEELLARLTAKGLGVTADGPLLLISIDGEAPYDVVRDEVIDLGVGLLRMEQRRHRLEDLFRVEAEETADV